MPMDWEVPQRLPCPKHVINTKEIVSTNVLLCTWWMRLTMRKSDTVIGRESSIVATSLVKRFKIRPTKAQWKEVIAICNTLNLSSRSLTISMYSSYLYLIIEENQTSIKLKRRSEQMCCSLFEWKKSLFLIEKVG